MLDITSHTDVLAEIRGHLDRPKLDAERLIHLVSTGSLDERARHSRYLADLLRRREAHHVSLVDTRPDAPLLHVRADAGVKSPYATLVVGVKHWGRLGVAVGPPLDLRERLATAWREAAHAHALDHALDRSCVVAQDGTWRVREELEASLERVTAHIHARTLRDEEAKTRLLYGPGRGRGERETPEYQEQVREMWQKAEPERHLAHLLHLAYFAAAVMELEYGEAFSHATTWTVAKLSAYHAIRDQVMETLLSSPPVDIQETV